MNLREATRLKIWLSVLGVFALGGVTGAALNSAYHLKASGQGMFERKHDDFVEALRHRLALVAQGPPNPAQVRAIMDETRGE